MAVNLLQEDIPAHFNGPFFKRALESGLRMTNIRKILDFKIRNLTIGGENYCSDIYRATVIYQSEEERHCERSLIIKSMPQRKQGVLNRLNIYAKETLFYLDIKPKLETLMWHFEKPWILGASHIYSTTDPEQTIIVEDLCKQGFELKSRQVGLDEAHAKLVMQKLAQYHALTLSMAEKEPALIKERYPFGLLNMDSIKAAPFKGLFGAQLLKLSALLAECADFAQISKQLLQYYEQFTERVLKCVYPLEGKINVLNHGDLWVNNIFFKYDNEQQLKEVRFIDFQLCYYGSPGFDVNYFLNTSVQLTVLQQQRERLISIYIDTLLKTLQRLPYLQSLPTREDLELEIQQRETYGFFVAFGFFPLMSMVSMDSQDNSLEKFHDEDFVRQKIELMFKSNPRTMDTLKYALKRLSDLGLLD